MPDAAAVLPRPGTGCWRSLRRSAKPVPAGSPRCLPWLRWWPLSPAGPDPFTDRSPRSSITLLRLEASRALAPSMSRVEPDVPAAMFASEDCVVSSRRAARALLCPRQLVPLLVHRAAGVSHDFVGGGFEAADGAVEGIDDGFGTGVADLRDLADLVLQGVFHRGGSVILTCPSDFLMLSPSSSCWVLRASSVVPASAEDAAAAASFSSSSASARRVPVTLPVAAPSSASTASSTRPAWTSISVDRCLQRAECLAIASSDAVVSMAASTSSQAADCASSRASRGALNPKGGGQRTAFSDHTGQTSGRTAAAQLPRRRVGRRGVRVRRRTTLPPGHRPALVIERFHGGPSASSS